MWRSGIRAYVLALALAALTAGGCNRAIRDGVAIGLTEGVSEGVSQVISGLITNLAPDEE